MKKRKNSTTTTKSDFERVEKALRTELLRLEEKMEGMELRIDENARKYRDNILTKLDGVMGELQTRREEDAVGTYQISEMRERVDDHETRITALEK